jgi:hypothetical protein
MFSAPVESGLTRRSHALEVPPYLHMRNVSSWTGLVFISGKENVIIHLSMEMLFLLELSSSAAVVDQHDHQSNFTDPQILKCEMISQPRNPPSKTPPLLSPQPINFFSIVTINPHPHTIVNQSQIFATSRSPTASRRHPNPHATSNRTRRPHPGRVNSALDQTDRRQDPFVATALHALPSVLADVGVAFGTLEAAVELALLEFGSHPGEGVEEVVAAGGGGVGGFVVC